jgi:hypothetical protein
MTRLGLEVQPANHLIVKVGTLGNSLQIIHYHYVVCEVLLCALVPFVIDGAEVPFNSSNTLQTAAEQV